MQDTKDIVDHVRTYTNPDGTPRVYIMLTVYFNDPTVNSQTNLPTCDTVAVWQALAQVGAALPLPIRLSCFGGSPTNTMRFAHALASARCRASCRLRKHVIAQNPEQLCCAPTDICRQPARHLQYRQRADSTWQLSGQRHRLVGQRVERDEHLRRRHPASRSRRRQPRTAPYRGAGVLRVPVLHVVRNPACRSKGPVLQNFEQTTQRTLHVALAKRRADHSTAPAL